MKTLDIINLIASDPRRANELIKLAKSYAAYRVTYRSDPEAWVNDIVDWRGGGPAFYQVRIMTELLEYGYLSERGPRGIGKTATLALLILWFATTRDIDEDWKLGTTASNWRQLTKFLWPEVHKWAGRLYWDRIGRPIFSKFELLTTEIKLATGMAFAAASDNSEALEGAHADSILYIFDESKLIPDSTWDSIEGTFMSGGDHYWLAIGTPGAPKGRFYDIHRKAPGFEQWHTIKVTLQDGIKAGRIDPKKVKQLEKQWGKNSSLYKTYVLGEFAGSDEELVIPLELVENAINKYENLKNIDESKYDRIGVDVGWGGDKTVLAFKDNKIINRILKFGRGDTMATVGRIKQQMQDGVEVIVDVIGIGAGVYDKLHEDGMDVIPFNAAEKTNRKDRSGVMGFANKRAAAWWAMRELLEDSEVALPNDDDLIGDLTAPRQLPPTSNGLIRIEPKDKIKARLGRSTDVGDAVVMAFWEEAGAGFLV